MRNKFSFKRWLRNWLNSDDSNLVSISTAHRFDRIDGSSLDSNPIRFSLYMANGGKVVEIKSYNEYKDQTNVQLFVIDDKADFGNELAKIITLTSLSQ